MDNRLSLVNRIYGFKNTWILLLLIFITGFNASAQNVFFSEMRIKPSVKIDADLLSVYTSNSTVNSGLFIYRILISVDDKTKSVFIAALQARGKTYQTQFVISSKNYGIKEPKSYKYYWLDPDRKRTQIDIIQDGETGKYDN